MLEPANITRRALAAALPIAFAASSAAALPRSPFVDPVLAQIELHKVLRDRVNDAPGLDDDPLYQAACDDEEAAIQALGDMNPTTLLGAAAQLAYMADVEEAFQDAQSPFVRCVRTVAQSLEQMARRASA